MSVKRPLLSPDVPGEGYALLPSNIVWLALLSFVESVQVLIVLSVISSLVPIAANGFVGQMFPVYLSDVRPEREMLLYRLFVFVAVGLQAALMVKFRFRLGDEGLKKAVIPYVAVSSALVLLQLFAVFKILIFQDPWWARGLLYGTIAAAVLTKIFWIELKKAAALLTADRFLRVMGRAAWAGDAAVLALIGLIIWIPDMDKALARAFLYDRFYHIDGFIMAPAWAYQSGLKLNVDAISQYGCLPPAMFSRLAVLMGGLSYQHILTAFITGTVIYFFLVYGFLRMWLGSRVLAAAGVLAAVKFQMFHWGVSPLIWQFLTPSVMRYPLDIIFLFSLWRHIQTFRSAYFWTCAGICGLAVAYMADTGLYLTGAWTVYVLLRLCWPSWKGEFGIRKAMAAVLLPFACAFVVIWLVTGKDIFTLVYWSNTFEHMRLFLNGWGALPVTDAFKDKMYYPVIKGLLVPAVYVWSMLAVGGLCWVKKLQEKHLLVLILCVYGLGLYHYYIVRSAVSSYEVVCIPFVFVMCFWLRQLFSFLSDFRRHAAGAVLLFISLGALLTNVMVAAYPNVFNIGRYDWGKEKEFYKQQYDLDADADLIKGLTEARERVPILSSFETALLIKAGRPPFFYYSPLVESSHWQAAEFRGTYLYSQGRMAKTIAQLEERKPEYIFVERKILYGAIPQDFYEKYQTLRILLGYVRDHYQVSQEGKYLAALRRIR